MLTRIGLTLEDHSEGVRVYRNKFLRLRPLDVEVGRYPLFCTDLQPILVALLGVANGESRVVEGLYGPDRFQYVPQLQKMGAQMKIRGNSALVSGIRQYVNAEIRATDIRGGAAVVLAALSAEGKSHIQAIHHIDRGYENFEHKLQRLGADITRVGDLSQDECRTRDRH
jgi:UDP-N-acetylglucosamine 1-carboxyvinyltransferase